MVNILTRLRTWLDARMRAWLLGPKFHAELHATVLRLAALGQPPAATAAPEAPQATQAPPAWFPLPGQVIEFRDTGFTIRLDTSPHSLPYNLYSPEGVKIGHGYELAGLKAAAERMAAERGEFAAAGRGLPPLWGAK